MELIDGSILDQSDGFTTQSMMFTYSEAEQLENKIAKNNAKLPLRPKFVPLYPELLWNGYSMMEALLFGFIEFFLSNNEKFYCTNEQLAEMFCCNEKTISNAMKSLEVRGDIKIHKKPKAGGGLIRFVTLETGKKVIFENVKKGFSKIQKIHGIYNKIINNNKDIDKSISLREEEKNDKNEYKVYGEFEHIKLTDEQYEKLRKLVGGNIRDLIDECDRWLELNPRKKYKNYYAFIKNRYKKSQKWIQAQVEVKQKLYANKGNKYIKQNTISKQNQQQKFQQLLDNNKQYDGEDQNETVNRRTEIGGDSLFSE